MESGFPLERLDEDFFNESGCSVAVRPEARCLCRAWLDVDPGHVVWDIGAGTGSVSLVSALRTPRAHYVALEKSPEHYRILGRNIRRLGVHNVEPRLGEAPEALADLPSPDRVYLGGTGGRIGRIAGALASVLGPSARLVASFVIDRNYAVCRSNLDRFGFRITGRTLEFGSSRSGEGPDEVHFLEAHRPVTRRFSSKL